ncbi:hypothetical protein GCM10011579_093180 [Streptomyces albiflavescens]|uniref:Uncharacterized protein n=1 Tax=Streptomyces albiflavescens TaxID=1623582 RepID=A0A917YED2_9ACTN|nr:hypothetical protein [Streptomyces albiflavescens]GGN94053.1 hypothetical protein GCM10011579_093180 [Streptomyces albiflavescens]
MFRTILRSVLGNMVLAGALAMAAGIPAQSENANSRALEVHAQAAYSNTTLANLDDHGWQ